jgi:catechol 2,3-dioxygenase-like lactoylglutathione lyase family enzyme
MGNREAKWMIRMIRHISAVTFAVRDMVGSVEFYRKLGFELLYGGDGAAFSSLRADQAFVNLSANPVRSRNSISLTPARL